MYIQPIGFFYKKPAVVTSSQTVEIDFGSDITNYDAPYPWNDWNNTSPGLTSPASKASLVNTDSVISGITLHLDTGFDSLQTNVRFDSSEATLPFPYNACRDGFRVDNGSFATLRLSALNSAKVYDFTFYGSRGFTGGDTTYEIGATAVNLTTKNNISNTVSINGVSPDVNDEIIIYIYGVGSAYGIINVLQFTERNP